MASKGCIARSGWLGVLLSGPLFLAGLQGSPVLAADGFHFGTGSLVGGLSGSLDSSSLAGSVPATRIAAGRPQSSVTGSLARQSVPARDRATSYRGGELFANSKTALPLLVSDLQPQPVSRARPMAGRSVGARPAATWTRSMLPVAATAVESEPVRPASGASWASLR